MNATPDNEVAQRIFSEPLKIGQKVFNEDDHSYMDITMRVLKPGEFRDNKGRPMVVTPLIIKKIHDIYNERVTKKFWDFKKIKESAPVSADFEDFLENKAESEDEYMDAPIQVNHELTDNFKTIGRVVGKLSIKDIDGEPNLFANVRIMDDENIKRVRDSRFRDVSVTFLEPSYELKEISFVTFSAIKGMRAFSENREEKVVLLSDIPSDKKQAMRKLSEMQISLSEARNQEKRIFDELQEKNLSIAKNYARISQLDKSISIRQRLVQFMDQGILTNRAAKNIQADIECVDENSLPAVYRMLSELPKSLEYKPRSKNKYAIDFEEMMMGTNKDVAVKARNFAKAFVDKVQGKNSKSGKAKNGTESTHSFGVGKEIKKENDHVENKHEIKLVRSDFERMQEMCEKKQFEELNTMLCSYAKMGEEDASKKEPEKDDKKTDDMKDEKRELMEAINSNNETVRSLSEQLKQVQETVRSLSEALPAIVEALEAPFKTTQEGEKV